MYSTLRETVEAIIEKYSNKPLDEFYQSKARFIDIKKNGLLDFSIEKSGDTLHVGHYRSENGKRIPDPVFVFVVHEGKWYPIRLEQLFTRTRIGVFKHGRYLFDQLSFEDVKMFADNCSKQWKICYLSK